MSAKFKSGAVKEYERKLMYDAIKDIMEKKLPHETTVGFTLCSDAVILEEHLANLAKSLQRKLVLFCAESNKTRYEIAKQKLVKLSENNEFFKSYIFKATDNYVFKRWAEKKTLTFENKFDFSWNDWCGPLEDSNIETLKIVAQFMKDNGLLAITNQGQREKNFEKFDQFKKFFKTDSEERSAIDNKALTIPSFINFKLAFDLNQKIQKGLLIKDAISYKSSFGEKVNGSEMLFYMFTVQNRDKKIHNNRNLKESVSKLIRKIVCHNGDVFVKQQLEGLK